MAWLEISKGCLFHNLDYFSNLVGGKSKIAIGLKDNAYGHGLETIASLCKEYGIDSVFVKNDEEAQRITQFEFESILILYGNNSIKYHGGRHIAILSIEQLQNVSEYSNVELKIDTGMHRNGILPSELDLAIDLIVARKLNLKGVFTHFSAADESNDTVTVQEQRFQDCIHKLSINLKQKFRVHCANSSGVHRVSNKKYDLFRIGIGTYGYIDLAEFQKELKPVMKLMANKISTRVINNNESVGYGSRAYINQSDGFVVSSYDIGYGDGFLRLDENKSYTLDDGRMILGRVSMDCLSVEGADESIELFNDVTRLADIHKTISYEILVALSPYIKRIIVD